MNLPDRILSKIQIGASGECWEWVAAKSKTGYGVVQYPHPDGRKRKDGQDPVAQAHRVVYYLLKGNIDVYPSRTGDADVLHHQCNNRGCVNPSHLEVTSNRENCSLGRNCDMKEDKTSRHRGVYWDKRNQKWFAQIQWNGKQVFLGRYTDEEEAARARKDYHGGKVK